MTQSQSIKQFYGRALMLSISGGEEPECPSNPSPAWASASSGLSASLPTDGGTTRPGHTIVLLPVKAKNQTDPFERWETPERQCETPETPVQTIQG